MPLTAETFAALVVEDTEGRWEIHRRKLREKPSMSYGHNQTARNLARQLVTRLPADQYDVLQNSGHAVLPGGDSYIPDVAIVPMELTIAFQADPKRFEAYINPLPFVAEVWSPSTGTYDVDAKIPGYRSRGDLEIWRVHPFEQTVTMWRRRNDGEYEESISRTGMIELYAVPGVRIDLDQLFGKAGAE